MKRLSLAFVLLTFGALVAQPPPIANPSRVSFEQRWPASNPQWFELVFQPDGSAKYRSLPHQEANSDSSDSKDSAAVPYELDFTVSPQSRQLIFGMAPRLPRLQASLDKSKVAFTGTKTLRYEDAAGQSSVLSYNSSSSPELSRLTALMQGISESIELAQSLQFTLRFDKLALDATLRQLEETVSQRGLAESQLISPILQRIANDPTVMNIARQRARRILQASPITKLR